MLYTLTNIQYFRRNLKAVIKLRNVFFCVFAICVANSVNAQNWNPNNFSYGELYPGYIVKADGERIGGHIKYRNRYVMQNEIIFYRDKDDIKTKKKYKPEDLKEYKVADKVYHCLNYTGSALTEGKSALLVVKNGCVSEYVWYERADGYNHLLQGKNESDEDFARRKYPETVVFYKSGDDVPVELNYFEEKFTKKMAAYIGENKALSSDVKSKKFSYGLPAVRQIMKTFNESCDR